MKSPEETPRLIDDPEIGRELELGLKRMSSNLPSAERLASMAARLGVTPNAAPASGPALSSKTLLKVAAGVGVSGAILWALLRGGAPSPVNVPDGSPPPVPLETSEVERSAPVTPAAPGPNRRAPATPSAPEAPAPTTAAHDDAPLAPAPFAPPAPTTETPEGSAPSGRTPAATPRTTEAPAPPSGRTAAKSPSKAPVPTSDDSPAPGRAPTASPPGETALLRDARLALNGEPARALALTEQHRRDYPSGGFTQEREVIAITALARLGRTPEARSRAERFRSAYPTSPYIERVDRAVPP